MGVLSRGGPALASAVQSLSESFGAPDYQSGCLPFSQSTYYDAELGTPLLRQFLSFPDPFPPDRLVEAKLLTNSLELQGSAEGRRRFNLDPGYVTLAKLVLATTKDQAHRLYLGRGIYAEVTLRFRRGGFEPWPWTYPDYRTPEYLAIFNHLRALLAASRAR